jgi:hypothetical protein
MVLLSLSSAQAQLTWVGTAAGDASNYNNLNNWSPPIRLGARCAGADADQGRHRTQRSL